MRHLLEAWPSVSKRLSRAERVVLMLDFDGTLAPIVPRPQDARILPEAMPSLLALQGWPSVELAIVSGRAASDVRALAGLEDTHFFGSHGRQRIRPSARGAGSARSARSRLCNTSRW